MMRWLRRERGSATMMALAFIALAVPLITAALSLASTLSIDSRVKTRILKSQYSLLGASQYALYRLLYETGYADGTSIGIPDTFTVVLNGDQIQVSLLKVSNPPGSPPPPDSDNSRKLQTIKSVSPGSAVPNVLTTFHYTIAVENRDNQSEGLTKIHDELPPGFTYLQDSTQGVTVANPAIVGQHLKWDLGGLQLSLDPGQAATLSFDAQATVPVGIYCNEAWAEPGGQKTSSGKTARVTVGSPTTTLCEGPAAHLSKTVTPGVAPSNTLSTHTYSILLQNVGTAVLHLSEIRDLLPAGFSYVSGTASGDITAANPSTSLYQGRQRLIWSFNPKFQVQPGEARVLRFDAQAQVLPGDYWNEVWVTLDEFADTLYSWPTAVVKVMAVFETTVSTSDASATSEMWVGTDTYSIRYWDYTR